MQRFSLAEDLLGLVDPGTPEVGSPHGTGLKAVRDAVIEHPDSGTQYESLEPLGRPFWFREFSSDLAEKALTYVTDSNLGDRTMRDKRKPR